MALINTSVPNLIQGVSQQPDAARFDGQCEEQENALSSVAEGLKKRPNTRHVARLLQTAIDANSFVHFINRSDTEKYVLIHDGAKIQAWNVLTGNEASINGSTGGYTPASGSYLDASSPRTLLKALTVADTTFVLNNQKGVAVDTNHTAALDKEALILINQGDYKKKYEVNVTVNPEQLSGFQSATANAVLERYAYSSVVTTETVFFITVTTTTITYRWRVASLNLTGVGAGYPQASLSFASDASTYQNASGTVAVDNSDGSIDSLTLVSNGEYAGTGSSTTQVGSTKTVEYGVAAPNISVNITANAGLGASSTTLSSFIWSGTSANSNNDAANTDYIAGWLSSSSSNSGFNTNIDRPMDVADGNGNKFTDFFDISRSGSLIKLIKKDNWNGDFTISTSDSLADDGMTAIYKEVSTITDLPAKCFNGFRVKVIGDTEASQDDYYVEFRTSSGGGVGNGSWIECAGFDIEKGFDPSTMPFSIINNNQDSFVIAEINYATRITGDELSNPNPSFVGREITNMFFFKNRLGFLSGDNVIFSEAGLGGEDEDGLFAYNFYRNTVSSLLDSAPIDISVSSRRVTTLESAVGFQDNLVLFSRTGQFVLKGADVLTPKTVSITPATNFDYDETVAPLPLGSYIYYPFNRGSFTGLREFTVNASTDNYDSAEVTEHVPAYVPSNLVQMKGTTSEDIIALVSGDETDAIYVYNYFWNNNQKVLSAWSKFTFTGEIRGIEFIESTLYMIMANNNQTHLVAMPLETSPSDIVLSESNGTTPNNPLTPDDNDDNDDGTGSVDDPSLIGGNNLTSSFELLTDKAVVPEGDTVTITLNTTGLADGTTVPYTITGDNITPEDLGITSLTGQFTVVGNTASVTFDIDDTHGIGVEDTETFTLSLDNGENSISVEIINNDGFTVLLVGDDFSSTWWNPELRVTRALDAYGNVVGSGSRYLYNPAYQSNPALYVFDEFESYDAPAYTGFEAVYNTVKYRQSSTGQIPLPTTYVIQGMGMIASIFHTTTLNFTIEEMTGDWEVFLQGNSNSIVDSDIIPLSSTDTTVTIPTPTTACDRILWRLTSETGSLRIKNISISMTRPLTAAESYALYGGTQVNP